MPDYVPAYGDYYPLKRPEGAGRPAYHNTRQEAYAKKFGIKLGPHPSKRLPFWLLNQLDRCKDDDARRLILFGICPEAKNSKRPSMSERWSDEEADIG